MYTFVSWGFTVCTQYEYDPVCPQTLSPDKDSQRSMSVCVLAVLPRDAMSPLSEDALRDPLMRLVGSPNRLEHNGGRSMQRCVHGKDQEVTS